MSIKVIRIKPTEHFVVIAGRGVEIVSESLARNASIIHIDQSNEVQILVYTPKSLEEPKP